MAHNESLKGLQARLAERLKLAQSAVASAAWLAVSAGGENYLLPLRQSGEILPIPQWQVVPHTKPWFLGVIALRGSLFGAVDLAQFIQHALGAAQDVTNSRAVLRDDAASIVTINPAIECGGALQVGRVSGLRSEEAFTSSSPAPEGAPPFFGNRFLDALGESWQEINLQALFQSPQFLNISV